MKFGQIEYAPRKKESKDDIIKRLMHRRDVLESALDFAIELIPKENLPSGVVPNTACGWIINRGKERLEKCEK